jgi:hypothetical protein
MRPDRRRTSRGEQRRRVVSEWPKVGVGRGRGCIDGARSTLASSAIAESNAPFWPADQGRCRTNAAQGLPLVTSPSFPFSHLAASDCTCVAKPSANRLATAVLVATGRGMATRGKDSGKLRGDLISISLRTRCYSPRLPDGVSGNETCRPDRFHPWEAQRPTIRLLFSALITASMTLLAAPLLAASAISQDVQN